MNEKELIDLENINNDDPLLSVYPLEFANYIYDLGSSRKYKNFKKIISDGIRFTYSGNYGAENAHICIGGVALNNLNHSSLESLKEKNVYFMGEMVDVDGYCGGFNLKWALVSALIVRDSIKK